jgi:maleate isomerase
MPDIAPAESLRFQADLRYPARRGSVGFIVLSTDETGEAAFKKLMPDDVAVFTTRAAYDADNHAEGGFEVLNGFSSVLATLPPPGQVDVVAFNCTSGTVASGRDKLLEELRQGRPGAKYTTPAVAAVEALRARGLHRIAVLTPYPPKLHALFPPFFRNQGFDVATHGTFALSSDAAIGAVSLHSIINAGRQLIDGAHVQALFISCTAFNVVDHIPRLEAELMIPVLTSTQALAWHVGILLGLQDA